MKAIFITSVLLLCCIFSWAQKDSLIKKHNFCFSFGGHYNYQDRKDIPYTGSWGVIGGIRVQYYKPTFGFNGEFTYLFSRKWFVAKTGILFYSYKITEVYNLDSSLKYLPNKPTQLIETTRAENSFLLPLMVGVKYKKFQFLFGENLFFLGLSSDKGKYYDSTTQQIKKAPLSGFYFNEFIRLTELIFMPSASFQYYIYQGKYNLLSSVDLYYVKRLDSGISLVLIF